MDHVISIAIIDGVKMNHMYSSQAEATRSPLAQQRVSGLGFGGKWSPQIGWGKRLGE